KYANDSEEPGNVELRDIIDYFARARTPACEAALAALGDPKQAYHALTAANIRRGRTGGWGEDGAWFAHPFCLGILRADLNNSGPVGGGFYKIEGDRLLHESPNRSSNGSIPDYLTDPTVRNSEAVERACDNSAEKLRELVFGLPRYHPLFKDAEDRL